jgi:hypothetical protein
MKTRLPLAMVAACVALVVAVRAYALIALQTPQVTTVGNVRVLALNCQFPNEVVPAVCSITYVATDGSGNTLAGQVPQVAGPLQTADVQAFFQAPGGFRKATQAALQSNTASLAGTAN